VKDNYKISRRDASKLIALGFSSYLLDPRIKFESSKQMNKRIIPKTNEALPVIGLGTWQTFDVGNSKAERDPLREVLNVLIDNGGSVIDSSPMYGRSEKVVGQLTTELNIKDKIFEATKVWTTGHKEGLNQIQNSFNLLKAEPIELLQVHNLLDWETQLKTLYVLKAKGKVKYVGITHYHQGGYALMEKVMKNEPIDFIQINYNLAVRDAGKRLLPLAQDKGIAVLVNRPYEGGTLFKKLKNKPLPEWAHEFDAQSWGQFFLKFILANKTVTCVIPGTSKPKHMRDNVLAGFGTLPTENHLDKMIELIQSV